MSNPKGGGKKAGDTNDGFGTVERKPRVHKIVILGEGGVGKSGKYIIFQKRPSGKFVLYFDLVYAKEQANLLGYKVLCCLQGFIKRM